MPQITNFNDMTAHLAACGVRKQLVVVSGSDESTLTATRRAIEDGFARATFVGDITEIRATGMPQGIEEHIEFVKAETHEEAAEKAVAIVRESEGGILVKGLLHTATLLRAVLHKEKGLLPAGAVLSHVACAEIPAYGKLLFFTDPAVIPYPTQEQREAQVGYLADLLHNMGIEEPRIALNHCAETVSDKFPHTLGYDAIKQQARDGRWGKAVVDGPLDLRTSCDPETLRVKGIDSPLQGRADAIVVPDIEVGNALYKALPFFAGARIAGRLVGTTHPVVLPSRGDDAEAKFLSLALSGF